MDAYAEGREACRRGDDPDLMNPYDILDAQHEQWLEGWLDQFCGVTLGDSRLTC